MIRLNDILEVSDARHISIDVKLNAHLWAEIELDLNDSAQLEELCGLYGDYHVRSLRPDDKGSRSQLEIIPEEG